MTDPQKLIRDVLRTHVASTRRIPHPKRQGILWNVAACDSESCDWVATDLDTDHDEHLAAEIDKALGGLTRDWRPGTYPLQARWVSGWSEALS